MENKPNVDGKQKNMRPYFAYGSNMDAEQMRERCPQSKRQKVETLSGYEFFINGRGFANIRKNKNKNVFGVVYTISEEDEKELDICEGVQYGTNTKENSPLLDAFYYIAKDTNEGPPRKGYLEKIIKAGQHKDNDFPKNYIDELKSWQHNSIPTPHIMTFLTYKNILIIGGVLVVITFVLFFELF